MPSNHDWGGVDWINSKPITTDDPEGYKRYTFQICRNSGLTTDIFFRVDNLEGAAVYGALNLEDARSLRDRLTEVIFTLASEASDALVRPITQDDIHIVDRMIQEMDDGTDLD